MPTPAKILCRRWNWRQDMRSLVTPLTTRAVVTVQSNGVGDLDAAVADLRAMLGRFAGADTDVTIADRMRPFAEVESADASGAAGREQRLELVEARVQPMRWLSRCSTVAKTRWTRRRRVPSAIGSKVSSTSVSWPRVPSGCCQPQVITRRFGGAISR